MANVALIPVEFSHLGLALTVRVIADITCIVACVVFFVGTAIKACVRDNNFVFNTGRRLTVFLIISLFVMAGSDVINYFPGMGIGASCYVLGMIRQFITCNVALWTFIVSYVAAVCVCACVCCMCGCVCVCVCGCGCGGGCGCACACVRVCVCVCVCVNPAHTRHPRVAPVVLLQFRYYLYKTVLTQR